MVDTPEGFLGARPDNAESFLGPRPVEQKPLSGELNDALLSMSDNPATHVLNAFGQGFKQAWGQGEDYAKETQEHLKKIGVYNDHTQGQNSILKGFNEAWIRPTVNGLYGIGSTALGVLSGAVEATGQAGQELTTEASKAQSNPQMLDKVIPNPITWGIGAAGEYAKGVASGFIPDMPIHIPEARSVGAIGESSETFMGTKEPTVEQQQARNEATGSLPQTEPYIPSPQPTIHDIAGDISQGLSESSSRDVVKEYEALRDNHDQLTQQIRTLEEDRQNDPKVQKANEEIEKLQSRPQLTGKQTERLKDIQGGLEDYLAIDTPEQIAAKQAHQENFQKLQDLAPDYRAVYREAQSRMPQEAATEAVQTGPRSALTIADEHQEAVQAAFKGAEKGLQDKFENRDSGIAQDASKKLQEAGRSKDESDALGQLIQSRYEARSSRFEGKLGTAKELYDKEAPEIVAGGEASGGKTFNQVGEPVNFDDFRFNKSQADVKKAFENWQNAVGFSEEDRTYKVYKDVVEKHEKLKTDLDKFALKNLYQDKRGSITINKDAKNTIRLFKSANASTAIHELGHQWLEELVQDAAHPEAPESLKTDLKTVKEWMGIRDENPVNRTQHERFARGFERYLLEGRAPSQALAGVFEKFKQWLSDIYNKVSELRSPINDNIRKVFDNLLTDNDHDTVIAPEAVTAARDTVKESKASPGKPEGTPESATSDIPVKDTEYLQDTGKYHLENISSYSDLVKASKQSADLNDLALKAKKGNISDQDRIDIAEAAGFSTHDINMEKLRAMSVEDNIPLASRIWGLGEFLKQNAQAIKEVLQKDNPTDKDMITFAEAVSRHKLAAETLLGVRGEWGRAGRALRDMLETADNESGMSSILQNSIGLTYHQIFRVMKDSKDTVKTTADVSKMVKNAPSFGQNLITYLVNNYISGPITHATYAMGITGNVIKRALIDSPLAAGIGSIRHAFGSEAPRVSWGEVGDELHAVWFGTFDGFRAVKAALKLKTQQGLQVKDLVQDRVNHEIKTGVIQPGSEPFRAQQLTDKIADFRSKFTIADIYRDDEREVQGQERKIPPEYNDILSLAAKSEAPQLYESASAQSRPHQDGLIGDIIRAPGERLVAPTHSMNYTISLVSNIRKLVSRQARLEADAKGYTDQQLSIRMAELQNDTPVNIIKQARDAALDENLLTGTKYNSWLGKYKTLLAHEIDLPVLGATAPGQIVQPFVSIISRVWGKASKDVLAATGPIAPLLNKQIRADLAGRNGSIARDLTIGKMTSGTAFFAAVWGMLESGTINDPASSNNDERIVQEMSDGLPGGVHVGDMTYETSRLGNIGLQMGLISEMHHFQKQWGEKGFSEAATGLIYGIGHELMQSGPVSGVSDLFDAISDPGRYGKNYINGFLTTLATPYSVGMGQISKQIDPYQREIHSGPSKGLVGEWNALKKGWEQNIPFLRESTLYPKIDIFGQPVPNKQFYGVYAEKVSNDPVYKAFKDTQYFPAAMKKDINGYELTEEEYNELTTKAGQSAKLALDRTVAISGFAQMSDVIKHDMLQKDMTNARNQAQQMLMIKYPDIPKYSVKMKKELAIGSQ